MQSSSIGSGREIHVMTNGDDAGDGRLESPLRTISAAARIAMPGDTVTVHGGTYRERIDPPRGGTSDACRITYRAAEGDAVFIKGSDVADGWVHEEGVVWKAEIPNELFGGDNPYEKPLFGHWFLDKGRVHHRGAVYLHGHWLAEAERAEDLKQAIGAEPLWHAEVTASITIIRAQLPVSDPNDGCVEINVRPCVFYPSRPGMNYITVRGFHLLHAAAPWSPPTTEQVGLIGVNWSKGWVIEDNTVAYSVCAGVTLGKYHDTEDRASENVVEGTAGADTYHGTIARALANGWAMDNIGGHAVRRNVVHHCEQAGIVGSLGCLRSTVCDNVIHDIHVRRQYHGFEQAGIKFHGAIDTVITRNRIYNCNRGIWLDWMSQGTEVTRNLLYANRYDHDLFTEVNHGPFLIANNLFLSRRSVDTWSHGGAFVHNLILGHFNVHPELGRVTPYHQAHSTEIAGQSNVEGGDDRLINNVVAGPGGLTMYDGKATLPVQMEGNLYLGAAAPGRLETAGAADASYPVNDVRVEDRGGDVYLHLPPLSASAGDARRQLVTTESLGRTLLSGLPFEHPDGSPVRIDTDYFGRPRDGANPFPGPFEAPGDGAPVRVWPQS